MWMKIFAVVICINFIGEKHMENRHNNSAWLRNFFRSEQRQRNRNDTHESKDELVHKTVLACICHAVLYCIRSSVHCIIVLTVVVSSEECRL